MLTFALSSRSDADERAAFQKKPPRQMRGFGDSDADIGDDFRQFRPRQKTNEPGVIAIRRAQVPAMIRAAHAERLREFSRAGTKRAQRGFGVDGFRGFGNSSS